MSRLDLTLYRDPISFNQRVVGSSPTALTNKTKDLVKIEVVSPAVVSALCP
jgi:hypothetical protein